MLGPEELPWRGWDGLEPERWSEHAPRGRGGQGKGASEMCHEGSEGHEQCGQEAGWRWARVGRDQARWSRWSEGKPGCLDTTIEKRRAGGEG